MSILILCLLGASLEPLDIHEAKEPLLYGDLFFEETDDRALPPVFFSLGYAQSAGGAFVSIPSIMGQFQKRWHPFFSSGVLAQWMAPQLTASARNMLKLQDVDIHFDVSKPQWAIFSLSQLQVFVGQWNLWNWSSLKVELLAGGGFGIINRKEHRSEKSYQQWSYLWSLEQRFRLHGSWGIQAAILGHRGAVFFQPALSYSF
jgi:hypothetical protein